MLKLDAEYWNNRYLDKTHRWDIGYPSPAITNYFDKIEDKSVRVLIPGCGSAYEGEYLHNQGFTNITLVDLSEESRRLFLKRVPTFNPKDYRIAEFFELEGEFDYIVEQTFFCALDPKLRPKYAQKMKTLLAPQGKLIGLMFEAELYKEHPPFGGCKAEYVQYFKPYFQYIKMELTQESIPERMGRELFVEIGNF